MAVAQTFFNTLQEGCFITSIDVYFKSKDTTQPITLAVIDTFNDRPGSRILPYSIVQKLPSDITTSTDASEATKFTFDSPVYLKGGVTYAFALDANSNKYEVFVSELGQTILGSTRRVSEQPAVGSLFKSQNVGPQNDNPLEDIKFTIRRADFTVNTTGTVTFNNAELTAEFLESNPLEVNATAGSGTTFGDNPAIIKVNHPKHGMSDGNGTRDPDKVTIAGLTDGTDYNGILGSAINGTHDIGNVTIDSYTITISGDAATSTGSVGGDSVTATRNVPFELLQPQIGYTQPPDTTITHSASVMSKQPIHSDTTDAYATTTTNIVPNDNFYFNGQKQIASPINETTHNSGNKSITYTMAMSTNNRYLSPVIDIGRTNLIAVTNLLDNPSASNTTGFIDETEPTGGSVLSKYITREIFLDTPATALDVRITANNYPTSSIKLLYKIRHVDDSRDFADIPYEYFNGTGLADDAIRYSEKASQTPYNPEYNASYFEQKFTAEGLGEFTSFAIKMVFTGTNPAYPPRVTDLRAIALAV